MTALHAALLTWYDTHARVLPWRDRPAGQRDPYRTWLSETVLQQTQVSRGALYFEVFLRAFPDVRDLAAAPLEAVLKLWEGAGYYARARNLHRAAQIIAKDGFPATLEGWRALPGVGRYTAGAVSSLAFNRPEPVVDGNVRRVFARWFAERHPSEDWLWRTAQSLLEPIRPGAWNEALIELGATVCLPKAPRCGSCPVAGHCAAFKSGVVAQIPAPKPRAAVRVIHAVALLVTDGKRVLLEPRAANGLLGGLSGVPLLEISASPDEALEALLARYDLEPRGNWAGRVTHTMTHRQFVVDVYHVALEQDSAFNLELPSDAVLSRLDHKILALAVTSAALFS